jgi:hypothetical protein
MTTTVVGYLASADKRLASSTAARHRLPPMAPQQEFRRLA